MAASLQLGDVLLSTTELTQDRLDQALERHQESGRSLFEVLLEMEVLPERDLLAALGEMYDIPIRESLDPDDVDVDLATRLPIAFARQHHILPLSQSGDRLEVAIADPMLTEPLDDLRVLFPGTYCDPVLVERASIVRCINRVFDRGGTASEVAEGFSDEDLDDLADHIIHEPEDLLDANDEGAPVVRLVNSLLQQAVKERASDIHVEPRERDLVVRFRVDDMLTEPLRPLPKRLHQSLTSRIKIMGKLDIAEKRLPQDGRIVLKIAGRDYDVRLSTVPTQYGERCVMRLLPRTQDLLHIARIGMSPPQQELYRRLIHRSNGIILVTGPTGSGKTSTLYAGLNEINSPDKSIITIEDPVEIQLAGVGQIEVKSEIGLTFARGLRSVLRQDPNVVLVGEIRDLETAEIAIRASLTGQLVFSTIHTIDSAGAIPRLIDMGVEPYLISSSLAASLAQRLIRVLCVHCKEEYSPEEGELFEVGLTLDDARDSGPLFRAAGCAQCKQTGYRGRTAIFEILVIDDGIRSMIGKGVDGKSIEAAAVKRGMVTMRLDGARKVLTGETSIAEVLRQTEEDAIVAMEPEVA
ncbi:MAG: type II secretion system ATPase GspE [Deltaproteobacteria bacterium]|nr:type II secretion system ATPase GspE [Deltaproteobacteria bacterium]